MAGLDTGIKVFMWIVLFIMCVPLFLAICAFAQLGMDVFRNLKDKFRSE